MSLTGIGRRISSLVAALFASACCTSLPRAPQKTITALPTVASAAEVEAESHIWRDEERDRDVPVKLWGAGDPARATRLPIVIVSHGIGEDRDSYEYLGRALASAGFLAVHITHAGTDRAMLEKGYLHLYRAVKDPMNWVNRVLDVSFVLDQLARDPRADIDRVAVAGHSAGAFTAFAVAGLRAGDEGKGTLRDERVKVIVPISMPRMDGVVSPDGYSAVDVPTLNITGTCDASLIYRTFPRHRRIPFESTTASRQYLVTIRDVNHDTFSAPSDRHHGLIATLVVDFLRAFLLGDAAAREWFDDGGLVKTDGTEMTVERK